MRLCLNHAWQTQALPLLFCDRQELAYHELAEREGVECQVSVPSAHMEEIVPAARLLSRATSEVPQGFEHSKRIFLHTVEGMKVVSEVRCCTAVHHDSCLVKEIFLFAYLCGCTAVAIHQMPPERS